MTTITAARKGNAAAIAADSLTTFGSRKDSADQIVNHDKILHAGDSYIAIAGPASAKLIVEHFLQSRAGRVRLDSVEAIFATWLKLHVALRDEYFIRPEEDEEDSYESSRMDALIVNPHGIFGVDALRCVQEYSRFYAHGYGQDYALGAMHVLYDDPERSAEDVARRGVETAAEFDNGTGLPILSYSVPLAAAPRKPRPRRR
jgi:ATP-dependent HslUV protease, peptidase subunit HslV